MTVFVDNAFIPAKVRHNGGYVTGKWCHMTADTREELDAMAVRIGMRKNWIQAEGTWREHYDVTESRRAAAVAAGAVEVDWREQSLKRAEERLRQNDQEASAEASTDQDKEAWEIDEWTL